MTRVVEAQKYLWRCSPGRDRQSRFFRAVSSWVSNIKDGDSATCPVQVEFPAFHFVPVASCPVAGQH